MKVKCPQCERDLEFDVTYNELGIAVRCKHCDCGNYVVSITLSSSDPVNPVILDVTEEEKGSKDRFGIAILNLVLRDLELHPFQEEMLRTMIRIYESRAANGV